MHFTQAGDANDMFLVNLLGEVFKQNIFLVEGTTPSMKSHSRPEKNKHLHDLAMDTEGEEWKMSISEKK